MSKIWGYRYTNNQPEKLLLPEQGEVDDLVRKYGEGVYTTLRTYHSNRVLFLKEHIYRLEHSAELSGVFLTVSEASVRDLIRALIQEANGKDIRIRLIVPFSSPETVIGIATFLTPPSMEDYRLGVAVETRRMHRDNPQAKVTEFIQKASEIRKQIGKEIHEVIMVDENGRFLEGLSSNFFAVHQGKVWTAGQGVLPGITRELVLKCVQELNLPLNLEGFPYQRLYEIEEAFLTSTSRGVLPVRKIDQYTVPQTPGKITTTLSTRFQERLNQSLEEV